VSLHDFEKLGQVAIAEEHTKNLSLQNDLHRQARANTGNSG
jgi:hypothetical protein